MNNVSYMGYKLAGFGQQSHHVLTSVIVVQTLSWQTEIAAGKAGKVMLKPDKCCRMLPIPFQYPGLEVTLGVTLMSPISLSRFDGFMDG